ncbi:replication initiation protein [Priestia megaterium]|nr:replication initiation protein [Priestia megaterium]
MNEFRKSLLQQFVDVFPYSDSAYRKKAQIGLNFYRTLSLQIEKEDHAYVRIRVDGYTVSLHKQNLMESTCSCDQPSFCEHQFAAVFYVYSLNEPLTTLFEAWRNSPSLATSLYYPKKEISLQTYTFAQWMNVYEEKYTAFLQGRPTNNFSIFHDLYEHFYRPLSKIAPSKQPFHDLFLLYGAIYTFFKLNEHMKQEKLSTNLKESFIYSHLYKLTNAVYTLADSRHLQTLSPPAKPLIMDSIPFIRMLLEDNDLLQYEKIELYRIIWKRIFKSEKWRSREEQWLRTGLQSFLSTVATAYLLFLQQKDDEAMAQLKELTAFPYVIPWMNDLLSAKDTHRFARWSTYLTQYMGTYVRSVPSTYQGSRNMVTMLLNLFKQYSQLIENDELYERSLRLLLPYSFIEYSEYLYHANQIKAWVELQTLLPFDHDEAMNIFEYVKEKDQQLLIPIYHQLIDRLLHEKKKQSYELAYQYLTKVKDLYVHTKQLPAWENYLLYLKEATKSLRSFQQLLKKGDLIDV